MKLREMPWCCCCVLLAPTNTPCQSSVKTQSSVRARTVMEPHELKVRKGAPVTGTMLMHASKQKARRAGVANARRLPAGCARAVPTARPER